MTSNGNSGSEVARISLHAIAVLVAIVTLPALLSRSAMAVPGSSRPNVAVSNSQSLLSSSDSALFLPVVAYGSGGDGATSVAVADINGDNRPDVLVLNSCADVQSGNCNSSIGVLLGNGDGFLQPAVRYYTRGRNATGFTIADVNGDHKPDIVVAHECGVPYCPGDLAVLLGNGDGTFRSPMPYTSGTIIAYSVAVADLNEDGKPDLIVTGCINSNCDAGLGILFGTGDGTFQNAVPYSLPGLAPAIAIAADVNRDGRSDILVGMDVMVSCGSGTSCPAGRLAVLLGNGDGTLQPAKIYSSGGTEPASLVVADANADGKLDVFVANNVPTGGGNETRVGVLLGNGDGTFQVAKSYYGGGLSDYGHTAAAVADVNGDGKLDVVVANACATLSTCVADQSVVGLLMGNGDGTFQPAVSVNSGGYFSSSVAIGDLRGVGLADVIVANSCAVSCNFWASVESSVGVLLNNSKPRIHTAIALTSSLNPAFVGQAITFTVTVTSDGNTPSDGEIVTFYNGSAVLATAALAEGVASVTISSLPAGIFTIKAEYPGDSNFAPSTSAGLRQVVNSTTKAATATTLATSLNPSKYGQAVTFTAKVTTSGPVPPTGTVAFTWKYFTTSYTIGTATVNSSGIASLTKSNLNAGLFPATAVYRGDASNLASTSPVVNQTVLQTTTSSTITSSVNPSTQGQAVTFTAKISSPTVMPTGPVTFSAGTTVLGSVQLSGGKASFTTSSLVGGSTVVKVTYNGNSNIKGSSAAVTQMVQP